MKGYAMAGIGGYHRGLAAPRLQADSSEPSWTVANPSTYINNSALWTACKESNQRMEARCKEFPHQWISSHEVDSVGAGCLGENRTGEGTSKRDRDVQR